MFYINYWSPITVQSFAPKICSENYVIGVCITAWTNNRLLNRTVWRPNKFSSESFLINVREFVLQFIPGFVTRSFIGKETKLDIILSGNNIIQLMFVFVIFKFYSDLFAMCWDHSWQTFFLQLVRAMWLYNITTVLIVCLPKSCHNPPMKDWARSNQKENWY